MQNLAYKRIAIENNTPRLRECGVPVEDVLDMLARGLSFEQVLDTCADLEPADVEACLEFACEK